MLKWLCYIPQSPIQWALFYKAQHHKSHTCHSAPYYNEGVAASEILWLTDVCLTTTDFFGMKDEATSGFEYRHIFALILMECADS